MRSLKRVQFAIAICILVHTPLSHAWEFDCFLKLLRPGPGALTALEKAHDFNRNVNAIGTFSEIGGAQRVSQTFFDAKQAKNTVAKATSPYAKEMSTSIYGTCTPFVCETRVKQQLEHEFSELNNVMKNRNNKERHFAFADTVATDKEKGGHVWMGMRFEKTPNDTPTDVFLHAKLSQKNTLGQQADVGKLGVNLIHGNYSQFDDKQKWINSLFDDLNKKHIEVDSIRISGPGITAEDNLRLAFAAVEARSAPHLVFSPKGELVAPSAVFFNKPILAVRNSDKASVAKIADAAHRLETATQADASSALILRVIPRKDLIHHGKLDYEAYKQAVTSGNWVVVVDTDSPDALRGFLKTLPTKVAELLN